MTEQFKEKGADLSHYQNDRGNIDFAKMKADGISFVMIKATQGKSYKDAFYEKNVDDAQAVGLKVGAYHFFQAGSVADAQAELDHFITEIKGDGLTYPAVIDIESNPHGLSKSVLTDLTVLFLEGLEKAGFFAMLYTSKGFFDHNLDADRLKPYAKWIARYYKELGMDSDMWQYTSTAKVSGVVGSVDVNWNYRSDLFGEKGSVAVVQTPVKKPETVVKPTPVVIPATYTVKSGDSLSAIADRFNVSQENLVAWNKITNPNVVNVGQVIKLKAPAQASYIGKRVESKVAVLNYYDGPRWNNPFGQLGKGDGFPKIVDRVNVDGSYQYKVKNSAGKTFYITASDKFVAVK
jgi:lysozyme